jgi:pimeloyl-ACP methyl ester carboxylesterase
MAPDSSRAAALAITNRSRPCTARSAEIDVADEDRFSVDAGPGDGSGGGLLSAFAGREPPAPDWFKAALAIEPERRFVAVDGANIEVLTWGQRGKPGLVFLHGNGAHADWWSFIAPYFAADWRVVALTWSGMGSSDWRSTYKAASYAREALAVIDAAGLAESPVPPVVVAHSFGGFIGLRLAAHHGDRLRGVAIVDAAINPPGVVGDGPPTRHRPNRVYPTFEAALARFRLVPIQSCENLFAVDYIARRSIKKVDDGYTWKFDPFLWRDFDLTDLSALLREPKCPLALVWGANSSLVTPEVAAYMAATAPPGSPLLEIPGADHHVMLDQPLAFVAGLRGLLARWPG